MGMNQEIIRTAENLKPGEEAVLLVVSTDYDADGNIHIASCKVVPSVSLSSAVSDTLLAAGKTFRESLKRPLTHSTVTIGKA